MNLADNSCDECGRSTKKIHRRYRGQGYCSSCYSRVFTKRPCSSCFRVARLPKYIPNEICRECKTKKACIRCGDSGKPVGKFTEYGTVCVSCAPYYRPKFPCDVCGRLSSRLTKIARLGGNLRRCERCAVSDHGTCTECRHYRILDDCDGRKICRLCRSGESRLCENCGVTIPAGRGVRCENCYWEDLFKKRVQMNSYLLNDGLLRTDFVDRKSVV